MNNMFFHKNNFNNIEPTKLAKPITQDPTKLGRKTVEEVKRDMHPQQPKVVEPPKVQTQTNQNNNINSLNAFKAWNKNK